MFKFERGEKPLSERRNIVVMADEAHRGQYGFDEKIVMSENGYVSLISPISGVEQFPRTHGESDIISGLSSHVETVCVLSRNK